MLDEIFADIDGRVEQVVDLQTKLVAIPALGPKNGGQGEKDKAEFLKAYLAERGFGEVEEIRAPDPSVECGYRPTLVTVLPAAEAKRTLWLIAHTDVVPPGDRSLWDTDPYTLVRDGDEIIGRGVEDNHQGLVSALIAAEALKAADAPLADNLGLILVADEETGSEFGLEYLVRERSDLFDKDDLFLIPDVGREDSEMVEVAEKSIVWMRVTVEGKQCHASTPKEGNNAMVAGSQFVVRIAALEKEFNAVDELFDPPTSTIQPTKREANVENVNTIPGKDVFYVDCRMLPKYDVQEVVESIKEIGMDITSEYCVRLSYDFDQCEQAAPATPVDSEIVRRTVEAVRKVYNNNPRPMGVGGGTVAAILRRAGYHAACWSTLRHYAHQPNERASISATLKDAKVMAAMALDA